MSAWPARTCIGTWSAIHIIVAACSVLDLSKQERLILRRTIIAVLMYGVVVSAVGAVML